MSRGLWHGAIARAWRPTLAAAVVLLAYLVLSAISADNESSAIPDRQVLDATYVRRVGDDSIYAFQVDGVQRTFRCTFCNFHFANVARGDRVTIHTAGARIVLVERGDESWSADTAKPLRYRWTARWAMLVLVGWLLAWLWGRRRRANPS